jgi:tripartite-type tricarboxylate transporter receptor subunit TctC
MRVPRRKFLGLAAAAAAFPALPHIACAQTYPIKPVRVIVPYAAGAAPDLPARIVAQKLSASLGQQFIIENAPGAGGNSGTGSAARAAPDGYTMLVTSTGFFVNPSLYQRVPYDPVKDFAAVSQITATPNVVVVNPALPVKTIKELIDYVKANPGKLSYAHASTGSIPHLSGELLKLRYGLDLVTVPFNSGPQAIAAGIGGHTPIVITSLASALPNIKDGKVRALAISSAERVAELPDLPTMMESGMPEQVSETITSLFVPAATPRAIIDRLYGEIAKAMAAPDVKDRIVAMGFQPMATTPNQLAERTRIEIAKWGDVIRQAHSRIDAPHGIFCPSSYSSIMLPSGSNT